MPDRPIIFSAPMIRALLDGRKTQTRRLFKVPAGSYVEQGRVWAMTDGCPYGDAALPYRPGDRLWVREAWRVEQCFDDRSPDELPNGEIVARQYEADCVRRFWKYAHLPVGRYRHAIHMPRWASRLTLLVNEVRVQRLHEISAEDAAAEGIPFEADALAPYEWSVARFADLWNSIHGPGAWDSNPWVAAISFDVQRGNIDAGTADGPL